MDDEERGDGLGPFRGVAAVLLFYLALAAAVFVGRLAARLADALF